MVPEIGRMSVVSSEISNTCLLALQTARKVNTHKLHLGWGSREPAYTWLVHGKVEEPIPNTLRFKSSEESDLDMNFF
jgi:hypothetical protein